MTLSPSSVSLSASGTDRSAPPDAATGADRRPAAPGTAPADSATDSKAAAGKAATGKAADTNPASAPADRTRTRDHRVDALRGLALLMMFVDHMPQNLLNRLTLRNLGFADAAEIFVLLAGYASWLAYGRGFPKNGAKITVIRIAKRCGRLYLAQTLMLIVCVVTIRTWRNYSPVPVDFLEPELAHGFSDLWRVLLLDALPSNLNILPLYMVLLGAFPLLYVLIRANRFLALALSMALWALININPDINFPNWLDPDGWYFDPLAWQFLFVLGASAAIEAGRHNGDLPAFPWLKIACGLYLTFSLVEAFPWAQWGLPVIAPLAVPSPDKSTLAPLRLLDVMAIFYLVQSSPLARRFSETRLGQALALCGRHSLEVFTVGTILDLFGRLIFTTFGDAWPFQIVINVTGLAILYGVTVVYERKRNEARARARAATAAA
ncbi:OpgC family protein [Acetobacter musti]|uniref:OpgC family protein n=1 Tax=Acetobacter musti TaxID=864732 RepID=UPI00156B4AE2|nr:OpgC domain-containing protein [Acetobacter musti]